MPAYKPIDPSARMTRADFVMELMTMWEETIQIIKRCPSGSVEELGTKAEIEAAIYVLKHTFPISELVPITDYEYLGTTADKVKLIQTRFAQNCRLVQEHAFYSPEEVEQKLTELKQGRDEELSMLDRRPIANERHDERQSDTLRGLENSPDIDT